MLGILKKKKKHPMRLSASFNFFDGAELLLPAIENIRPQVEHISVLYQTTSNYGNPIPQESLDVLQELKIRKLVDDFWHYKPDLTRLGRENEFTKRNKGLEIALGANCNYLMMLDADEFYIIEQLELAKKLIVENDWQYTAVPIYEYYIQPTWRIKSTINNLYCPFICQITENTRHDTTDNYEIRHTDPTRRLYVKDGSYHLFDEAKITMHHMTGVRANGFYHKLANTSYNDTPFEIDFKHKVHEWIINHLKPGSISLPYDIQVVVANYFKDEIEIIETADFFNLSHLF